MLRDQSVFHRDLPALRTTANQVTTGQVFSPLIRDEPDDNSGLETNVQPTTTLQYKGQFHHLCNFHREVDMGISLEEAARKLEIVTGSTHESRQSNGPLQDLEPDGLGQSNHAQLLKSGLDLHPENHLNAQEPIQLLSPSPSPSRRSSSPSSDFPDSQEQLTSSDVQDPIESTGNYSNPTTESKGLSIRAHHDGAATIPRASSKPLSPGSIHEAVKEKSPTSRKPSISIAKANGEVLKLSAADMAALTSAPESLPVTSPSRPLQQNQPSLAASPVFEGEIKLLNSTEINGLDAANHKRKDIAHQSPSEPSRKTIIPELDRQHASEAASTPTNGISRRPGFSSRSISAMPPVSSRMASYQKSIPRQVSPRRRPTPHGPRPEPLDLGTSSKQNTQSSSVEPHSPVHIPLPPMSIPTYLQLELSSSRPSPLYIYRAASSEYPYESSKIKFERLLNFLLLPPQLEQVLYFGSMACLDAWLYTFTILPLRFLKALIVLVSWWGEVIVRETRFVLGFIYHGVGRFWHRQRQREDQEKTDSSERSRSPSRVRPPISSTPSYQSRHERPAEHLNINGAREASKLEHERRHQSRQGWGRRHRRTKSVPSSLSSHHKADLLQGAVIICSCIILLKFDASRMYHSIRGQAAIKLYVIYNVLEV